MENRTVAFPSDLITFIADQLGISRNKAKAMIDSRRVFVNNRRVWMAGHNLKKDDIVEFGEDIRDDTPLLIIYEDDYIIAVNKPSGIISDEGGSSLESVLRKKTGNTGLKAIHRLDRDTSGVLLFAKKKDYFETFKTLWKEKSVRKVYLAICHNEASFEINNIDKEIESKNAFSRVSLIKKRNGFSYFRVEPVTGRKHQIRIHLASIRHPVVGDNEYGFKEISDPLIKKVNRQMLHSHQISFKSPFSGRELVLTAPVPPDFKRLLRDLELEA
jgi:23S rRNA pseudouridine1911/1915/1917 synthase